MFFQQILDPDLGCACYVLGCVDHAVVVDPCLRVDLILAAAADHDAEVRTIVETHVHADHVSGRGELAERTGAVVRVPAGGGVDPAAGVPLSGGETVIAGRVRIEALAAPGHRPEHLALLVTDSGRSDDPWALLSGDSLLVGDLARPDLAVDAEAGAADLHATLARLADLPDHVELWPGHIGGSLCGGAALSPKPSSTLGYERRVQALLREPDVGAFTAALTAALPSRPPTVEHVVARNRSVHPGRPAERRFGRANGRFVTPSPAIIVDGRTAEAFDAEHLRGAVSLPLSGTGVGTRAGWVLDADADVVVTAATAREASELAQRLRAVGIDRIRDTLSWTTLRSGVPLDHAGAIDVAALPDYLTDLLVVDVRDDSEWRSGHLAESVHLPLSRLRAGGPELPRGRRLAVACAVGGRAAFAASWLRRLGHDATRVTGGGIPDLLRLGVPLTSCTAH